jgi:hypothetical protein
MALALPLAWKFLQASLEPQPQRGVVQLAQVAVAE